MKRTKIFCLFFLLLFFSAVYGQVDTKKKSKHAKPFAKAEQTSSYLFVYFTGNGKGEEQIRFALSKDGYNYRALNGNKPVIDLSKLTESGGVRDPHILRAQDGKTFYMVATDMLCAKGWDSNRGMVLMKSSNLIDWQTTPIYVPTVFPEFSTINRVWAPQTIYDAQLGKYMVYWSMRSGKEPDKIYYAYTNKDFTGFETKPKQLFFSPTNNACIDAEIINFNGKFHLFFKTEDQKPGIKKAVSTSLTEGYKLETDQYLQQTSDPVEGAGVFKLNEGNDWILMYDVYTKGKYQFTKSSNLTDFKAIDNEVAMNFHPRHGTILPITEKESKALAAKWMSADDVILSASSPSFKKININLDSLAHKLYLPVKNGTDLKTVQPTFSTFSGVDVKPIDPVDFSKGSVRYAVTIEGKQPQTYELIVTQNHNPVLEGYYADPEILYAEKTGKFYIYPTSDGFNNWSGTYFKAFSSDDLKDWKDEGIILDLTKDVSWAKRNAWAPCIVEKKIAGAYKYFYYFTAAQKIGVAVADNPTGPFTDSGKPLIEKYPDGVSRGQQIDPDVFTDPQTGKSYLYWGNGYMAGAELSDDMLSIKQETTKIITPNEGFREGTYVFYRKGTYYFMWSEDDTRSVNYRVRYGTSKSPLGPIQVTENNLVIASNTEARIFATGHNSVVQIPGKDEWYIVYHRFNFPNGINMGQAAGFNREVCIDKLQFKEDGSIIPVKPTHEGIH